jgi:serine/threonine protein kinase
MTLTAGTKLGPYEILSAIGAGGMGEVYKARDTRLNRTVAIKVLPSHFSDNAEMKSRFDREAQTIAGLNHPHICVLHDVGHQDGTDYLVMEYLEGQTLAQRLEKGALRFDEALKIAIEIADALDKAHRQGIVHRDLKPSNVMLTKSGTKLLDFGLAKLKQQAQSTSLSDIPTNADVTAKGTILGTLQYMAPEQLEGEDADARTDIFAFGAILYEMVTGKKAFEGKSQASLISAIMTADPTPMAVLQPITPPGLDHIVRVCLAKNPDERWQSAGDLVRELKWIATNTAQISARPAAAIAPLPGRLPWKIATISLAVAALAASVFVAIVLLRPAPVQVIRFQITAPENTSLRTLTGEDNSISISPDGTRIAFFATDSSGKMLMWTRSLDSFSAQALAGTDGAQFPFWSPDSRFIGFFAQGKLRKIDTLGGPPQTICDVPGVPRGGSWSKDGLILFGTVNSPILRVSAEGGKPAPVTKLDIAQKQGSHRWPYFLPDSRHFLYWTRGPDGPSIYAGSIDSETVKFLFPSNTNAIYAPPGFVLFSREGILMRQGFDPTGLELKGDAAAIAGRVDPDTATGLGAFSVSTNGVLSFQVLPSDVTTQFTWFDRRGRLIENVGPRGIYQWPALSPDETRLAFTANAEDRGSDLWLMDIQKQSPSRFTFGRRETSPVWSPDGTTIFYTSGVANIFQKNSSGTASEQLVLKGNGTTFVGNLSPDGKFLVFSRFEGTGLGTGFDIFVLPLTGEGKPIPVAQTRFREEQPQFSPDGKWIAYTSNESGQPEVYVQPFPTSGSKWQISNGGGAQPMWRRDGKELFFIGEDRKLYATDIRAGSTFEFGMPHSLFEVPNKAYVFEVRDKAYVPSRNGERFLVSMSPDAAPSPINIVVNWTAALNTR